KIFYSFGVIAVPSTAVVDSSGSLWYGPAGYSLTTKDRIVDSLEVFLGLKKPEEAAAFRADYRPNNKSSRFYGMALDLTLKRSWERALAILDSAEAADTKFAGPHVLRGEILMEMEKYGEATAEFEKAITLDSMVVAAWAGWGRALMSDSLLDSADVKLRQCLSLDDAYTPAKLDFGLCLARQGKTEEALDSLGQAYELNRADPEILYSLGIVLNQAGRQGEALEAFLDALKLLHPGQ
ncbi:MAG: tetratricopeptide repeat protein, partial [candidate division Zixibacteria bacterium]